MLTEPEPINNDRAQANTAAITTDTLTNTVSLAITTRQA